MRKEEWPKIIIEPNEDHVTVDTKELVSFKVDAYGRDNGIPLMDSVYRLEPRTDGELRGKAVFLPDGFEYAIVRDSMNALCLIILDKCKLTRRDEFL